MEREMSKAREAQLARDADNERTEREKAELRREADGLKTDLAAQMSRLQASQDDAAKIVKELDAERAARVAEMERAREEAARKQTAWDEEKTRLAE